MARYLIQFRIRGYAKRYAKQLIYDVSRKFRVKGMTRKHPVPHITLYGPFTTNNERGVVSIVQEICEKYDRVYFSFRGFNSFNNSTNKVVYMDIVPSDDLRDFRYELASKLRRITSTISIQDKMDKTKFMFHATIAFKDIDQKFKNVWDYINGKEKPNIRQTLLRVTILKNGKILYEYDLLQKKLLNRTQSLNKLIFRRTIEILKQTPSPKPSPNTISKPQKLTIWEKIKKFFEVND